MTKRDNVTEIDEMYIKNDISGNISHQEKSILEQKSQL